MSDLTLSLERAIFFEDQQASNIIFSLKKIHPGELFFVTRCAGNKPIIIFGLIKKSKSNVNLHQFLKTLPCFVFIPCNKPGPISVHVFTGLTDLFVDIVLAKGQCKRGSFLYRRSAPSPSRVEGLSRS